MDEVEFMFINSTYAPMFSEMKAGFTMMNELIMQASSDLKFRNILKNWTNVESQFIKAGLSNQEVIQIGGTIVSPQIVFPLFLMVESFECSRETLTRYIEIEDETLINATCSFIDSELMVRLLEVVDPVSSFEYLEAIMDLSPSSLATESNISVEELTSVMESINGIIRISPSLKDNLIILWNDLNTTNYDMAASFRLLCGTEFSLLDIDYEVLKAFQLLLYLNQRIAFSLYSQCKMTA